MSENVLALNSFNVPVQTILVRKVGALFLKNLFYYFDQFKLPKDPYVLEDGTGLSFETPLPRLTPFDDIRFALYRDPMERFISFYYDEIFEPSPRCWTDWRNELVKRGAKFPISTSKSQHSKNLSVLLSYIEEVSKLGGMIALPDHLAPQYKFLLPASDLGFELINLNRANFELVELLAPFVDNIEKTLKKVEKVVPSKKENNVREIVTQSHINHHRKIYEGDYELYWAYRDGAA